MNSDLLGHWEGAIQSGEREVALEVEIAADTSRFHIREMGLVEQETRDQAFTHDGFRGTAAVLTLEATLADGGLAGTLDSTFFGSVSVTLQRHHPAITRLQTPRVGARGERITRWECPAPPAVDDWSVAQPSAVGFDEAQLTETVERILRGEEGAIRALSIARHGALVVDEYFHGAARDVTHTVQSVTKSVTSLVLGGVLAEHTISLETPVHEFFSHFADAKWVRERYPITLEHALTMSANIEWNEELPYTDPANSNTAMNASPSWFGYVLDRPQHGEPGLAARYTSGLTLLIGGVIQIVAGRYVDEVARDGLFAELGITDFGWSRHPDGTRHTGGGLGLRARDLAKLGQLVLDNGVWNGRELLPEAWIEASTTKRLPIEGAGASDLAGYGYQWWMLPDVVFRGEPVTCCTALGYGGQMLAIVRELDLIVVMNAIEWVPGPDHDMVRLLNRIIASLDA